MACITKEQLAQKYGISRSTLYRYLKQVPGLVMQKNQKVIFPAQLKLIINHLGEFQ